MSAANKYDEQNIATMEMIYGEGYLSAGGDSEVAAIVENLDLSGTSVLDLGCGLGGAAITLARDHGAATVRGADIDSVVLARADELVNEAGLEDRIHLDQICTGSLPYETDSFDLVYLTAVSCHIEELVPFFSETCRVLKPGGAVAGCEWIKLEDNAAYRDWDTLLRQRGLNFFFVDRPAFKQALVLSGLEQVEVVDRTAEIASLSLDAVDRVDGELKQGLVAVLGDDGYQACRQWTSARAGAYHAGGIGQCHFRAFKVGKPE